MDTELLAAATVAFLVAGFVKGVIGLGLPTTSVAILSTVADLRTAVAIVVVPAVVTNLWQATQGGMLVVLFKRYWLMNTGVVVGTYFGTVLLFLLNQSVLLTLLGIVVCVYALFNLFTVSIEVPQKSERPLAPFVGLLSGLLTGTTGSVGIPVAIFLDALRLDKDTFVRAIALSFMISAAILGIGLVQQGGWSREHALVSCASLVPAFLGMYAGSKLRARLSPERFRTYVMVFLLIIAANLLRKALF